MLLSGRSIITPLFGPPISLPHTSFSIVTKASRRAFSWFLLFVLFIRLNQRHKPKRRQVLRGSFRLPSPFK